MTAAALHSPAFGDQETLPGRFSRQGGNVSPPLEWSGVPDNAAELMLVCEDPDAPGSTPFLHWLVTGIPADLRSFPEGRVPPGAHEWPNDFGQPGWGGPQPPVGDGPHRYVFRLYALEHPAHLPDRPTSTDVRRTVKELQLDSATLVGRFAR
jgi:Raf kinase inhibitor-like YbhB/YbcL family protein